MNGLWIEWRRVNIRTGFRTYGISSVPNVKREKKRIASDKQPRRQGILFAMSGYEALPDTWIRSYWIDLKIFRLIRLWND
jgi:hypothetical protein